MARQQRLELPGGLYHVTARGNERKAIYRDDGDRQLQLSGLEQVVARFGWLVLAYCQMGNHFHLLVETPRPNLALGMRQLNGVYAQRFNRRHRRVGHLFQGRFTAILVERDSQLLAVARYVLLNPVRAGLRQRAEEWPWSSYRATIGIEPVPSFLACDRLLELVAGTGAETQVRFRAFVDDGLGDQPLSALNGSMLLGGAEYVAAHADLLAPEPEIPRRQWQPRRPSLEQLFTDEGELAIATAYRKYGYRMREIASHLGVHYATVSRRLAALEERGV